MTGYFPLGFTFVQHMNPKACYSQAATYVKIGSDLHGKKFNALLGMNYEWWKECLP